LGAGHLEEKTCSILNRYFSSKAMVYNYYDLFKMIFTLLLLYSVENPNDAELREILPNITKLEERSIDFLKQFWFGAGQRNESFGFLRAGFFDQSPDKLHEYLALYDQIGIHPRAKHRLQMQDFSAIYNEGRQS
jgi:hypothetical protein